ncbi:MAG: FixH family protein [Chitinophagaceae bacterium]|nr:FixH family protein [Chitinophagaceae bacterium]
MNWGTKILIVYVAFISGVLYMVFKSSSQKSDLVTADYYAKELRYQEKIDEMNRVVDLRAPVEYEIRDRIIYIRFPGILPGKTGWGSRVVLPLGRKQRFQKEFFAAG